MVPYVALPLVTPFTVQVTAVFVVFATETVIPKVAFTSTVWALVGLVMESVTAGGGVELPPPPPPPQPTTAISKLKLIPRTHALRRRPRLIVPAPIDPEFRFASVHTERPALIPLAKKPTAMAVLFGPDYSSQGKKSRSATGPIRREPRP